MKRIYFLTTLLVAGLCSGQAQVKGNDSTYLFLDSLYAELPEVMIKGERPVVKAEEGKLIYDLPRLVNDLPVDNAYDALKELPGVVEQNEALTLAGGDVNVVIDGKVSTLTAEQLSTLLKSIPVSRIEKAEVMYSAPARYQVRGPMINIILKREKGEGSALQGEFFSSWKQLFYETLTERASLLYSSTKFSTDLLYSYRYGRSKFGMDKEALHTVSGTVYPIDQVERSYSKSKSHDIRWGVDYNFTPENVLSLVYTAQLGDSEGNSRTSGTQLSRTERDGDKDLHNVKLDYSSSFGLSTGAEFTFYESPGTQELHSILNEEEVDARYEDKQRINKWRFYATQEHSLKNSWQLNYGTAYSTAVDNSFQNYFDAKSGVFSPENSMRAKKREYALNGFVGINKSFGSKVSMDASFAAEKYHTDIWNEWMFYPTLNVNYMPSAGHILQLSFSSDKEYPDYWAINNVISYMSAYSEIRGNPDLKPSQKYRLNLNYILRSKYVLTAFFNYTNDYFVQTLYQRPDKLQEVYKVLNFDYQSQVGLQASVPFKVSNWLNSRITLVGYRMQAKDSDFWDIPFNRSKNVFIGTMNHSVTLCKQPDIRLNISGFYQSGAIQGIYDLSSSGNMDASLQWRFCQQKAQLTLKGIDLFETSLITPKIRFKGQHVTNTFTHSARGVEVAFSYKLGNYKEKKREEVDTSRFK